MHETDELGHGTLRCMRFHRFIRLFVRVVGVLLSLVFVTAAVLLRHGCSGLDTTPRSTHAPSVTSWEALWRTEPSVTVEAWVTGETSGDRRVVLDPADPHIERLDQRFAPSPVLAYHIEHPRVGHVLVDAGLSRAFGDGGDGNYTAVLELVLAAMDAAPAQVAGQAVVDRVAAAGWSPAEVLLTHLHADHTSGVRDLDCSVTVSFGAGEDTFLQRAMMGDHLDCRPLRAIDLRAAPPMPPFEHAVDLYGDGSVWAVATPGHSPDHVSYVVHAKGGPWLITGDAAAYVAQLRHRIRPAPGVDDPQLAARSLLQLAEFVERFPNVRVAVGHEQGPPPGTTAR